MVEVLIAAVAGSALTTAWHELVRVLERRKAAHAKCLGHRWVYHSLYRDGTHWNRICGWCGKHEERWAESGVPKNWPPTGARLRRGEAAPNLARRPRSLIEAERDS